MTKILRIYNDGLLDINELRLMGCSSKTEGNTIGCFGSGLKYSLAVLMREKIDFDIYIGNRRVNLDTETIRIRDNTFERILIDFQETSITTNLGIEWTVGQGLREFIANAIDEGGFYEVIDRSELKLDDCKTTIVFKYDDVEEYLENFDFDNWIKIKDGYFYKKVEGERQGKVFKEGFLVYIMTNNSSYDYRIDDIRINESRVAEDRWQVRRGIAEIQRLMKKEDVETIVKNNELEDSTFYESDTLGEGWDNVLASSIKSTAGYDLSKTILKNSAEKNNLEKTKLLYNSADYVDYSNEIEPGIYLQAEWLGNWENDWDYDSENDYIFIAFRHPESYYIDSYVADYNYQPTIKEAKRYREASKYVKSHGLQTAVDVTRHFLDKESNTIYTGLSRVGISGADIGVLHGDSRSFSFN